MKRFQESVREEQERMRRKRQRLVKHVRMLRDQLRYNPVGVPARFQDHLEDLENFLRVQDAY